MDLEAARARAEELMARFEQLRDGPGGLRALQRSILAVEATATSDDGFVTATVGPRGQLVQLELSPRIYRRPDSRRLAEVITKTIQAAAADAVAQVTELTRPFVPDADLKAYMNYDFDSVMQRLDHELADDSPPGGGTR